MIEEFESIRNEMYENMNPQYCTMQPTIQHLTLLCSKYESEFGRINTKIDYIENDISKLPIKNYDNDILELQKQISSLGTDNKSFYDQISDIINNIDTEMTELKTKQDTLTHQMNSVKTSV